MTRPVNTWISCALLVAAAGPACTSSDPPPRRTISNPGDTESGQDASRDATDGDGSAPARVTSWLEEHPNCVGDGTPLFRDATLSSGAWHFQAREPSSELYDQMVGGGVAMADFDGDGDLDLYVGVSSGPNALLVNDGRGHFSRPEAGQRIAFAEDWTNGVSAIDYDNDGDQDLFSSNRGADRLLENQGDLEFRDVTDSVGINSRGNNATASWGDLDGDGWLDLVIAKLADSVDGEMIDRARPVVYMADGEGRFERLDTRDLQNGSSYIMPILDLDLDGDLDILHPQEFRTFEEPSIIENQGSSQTARLSWTVHELTGFDTVAPATMGAAILDTNGDDLPDIYTTNLWGEAYAGEVLAENLGDLSFENVAPERGAQPMTGAFDVSSITRAVSWAAISADFRNLGRQDLFVAYGQLAEEVEGRDHVNYPPLVDKQPDALLLRTASGGFEVASGSCAESMGDSRGAAVGDVDGDGCLDLVVVPRVGSTRLLLNRCENDRHYLGIELVGSHSNRDAIGSTVHLETENGVQRRWVTAGSTSVFSSSPKVLHFGLGESRSVETLRVRWPDGAETVIEDVEADRRISITQPEEP